MIVFTQRTGKNYPDDGFYTLRRDNKNEKSMDKSDEYSDDK